VINGGRGAHVVEEDLIAALGQGQVRGGGTEGEGGWQLPCTFSCRRTTFQEGGEAGPGNFQWKRTSGGQSKRE
jgi:hypothetical protein